MSAKQSVIAENCNIAEHELMTRQIKTPEHRGLHEARRTSERIGAAEAVEESEKRYRDLYESSVDGIALTDLKGRILEVNQAYADMVGYSRTELKKLTYQQLTPKKWREDEAQIVEKQVIGGRGYSDEYEKEYIKKNGTILPISIRVWRIENEQGKPDRTWAIVQDITKRKQVEEMLRESEEKYRAIVENSPNLIGIFQNGALKYINSAGILKLGWTVEEAVSPSFDPIEKVVSQKSRSLLKENIGKRLRGEGVPPYEITLTKKDGSEVLVVVRAAKIIYNQKPAIEFAFDDITERKRAEELLRESEERFREAMEATNDGLWDWNVETGEMYYSPAYYRMLGYEPGDFPSNLQFWLDHTHPDDRVRAVKANEDCIENRIPKFEVEFRMKAKDGEWRWILGRGRAISRDAKGRALRMIGTHVDITNRKRLVEEVSKSRQYLLSIIYNANVWLDVLDEEGNVQIWNEAAEAISGYSREEVVRHGKIWEWLYPDEQYRREVFAKAKAIIEQGQTEEAFETRIRRKDGQVRTISWNSRNLLDENHRSIGSIAIGQDVTERNRMEKELKQHSEHLEELVEEKTREIRLARERLAYLIQSNPAVIYSGKPASDLSDWYLTYLSDRVVSMLGYEPREFIGHPEFWMRHVHPDDLEPTLMVIQDLWKGGQHAFEYRFQHKDGRYRWIREEARAECDANGRPIEVNGYWTDCTDRKRMEEELRTTKERLDFILDSSAAVTVVGTLDSDPKGFEVTYMSDNVRLILGYDPKDFIANHEFWASHLHPEDSDSAHSQTRLIKDGQMSAEYRFLAKDGTYRWMRHSARAIPNHPGNPIELVGYWIEISEQKRMEEENRKLNAEVTQHLFEITDQVESLAKLREKLRTVPDVASGLEIILDAALWDFSLDFGAILTLDRQANTMKVRASKGKGQEVRLEDSYPLEGFVELEDLQTKSVTKIVRVGDRSIFNAAKVHTIPILSGKELYGVLAFGNVALDSPEVRNMRILELYAELVYSFVIERSVTITPALESISTGKPTADLEAGQIYLIRKDPAKAFSIFAVAVFSGYEGLCITRIHPSRIRSKYGLEKTPIVWLTSEASGDERSVKSLRELSIMVGDFLDKAEKPVILLDGFEYLIVNNGFESFIKFLQVLKDRVQRGNGVMIAPFLEQTLGSKELALLQRETVVLTEEQNGIRR